MSFVFFTNQAFADSLFHTSFDSSFSVSNQETGPTGIAFNSDGTKMFVVGFSGDDVNEYTLSTAFDVSTASFVDSFSVSSEETSPSDLAFNSDGTKMFVVGFSGDDVNEYTLSTAFDVSTALFVDSFSVSDQETGPQGLAFNSDGTKMFVVGNTGDNVNEYTLSTAFDVSTASFVVAFSVSSEEASSTGLAFNSDGTKMFVVGFAGDDVNEYTLSTAFDVSTASFVDSFSVSDQETGPTGIAFNSDGTKMFVVGFSGDDVNEYTLSTAFSLFHTSFDSSFSVSNQETVPQGIAFNSDGTKMFVVGTSGDDVNEYTLSTAFDVSTALFVDSFSVSDQEATPTDVAFNSDGTKMFVVGDSGADVNEYTLSTAFDVSTALFVDSFSVSDQETGPQGLAFNSDGTKMFVVGDSGDDVNEYTLSTAFDVSTALFVDSFSVSNQETSPSGLAFNSDGTKMFVLGSSGDNVNEYTLSTAFDVSTASFVDSFSVLNQEASPRGLAFNSDGTKMFVVGFSGDNVNEYTLSTAFSLFHTSFDSSFSVSDQEANPTGLAFNSDGTKMFVVGDSGDDVNEYTLSAAFDVSTASFVDSFSVSDQETGPQGLAFNSDGTKMFVLGSSGDNVNEYTLSTAFDVSTALFVDSFSVSSEEIIPTDVAFNSDGTKMFVVGFVGADVNEYTLSAAFDVSTALFVDSFSVSDQEATPTDVAFNSDGTKMFVVGDSGADVNEYTLSAAFDVSTALFVDSFSVSDQETGPQGLAFNSDGTKMFVVSSSGDDVNEYSINLPPPDIANPTFTSSALNEGTGVLTITFNETIDATPSTLVDLTKLFISNTGNTDEITLSGAVVTATDGTTITITLTESQRQQVIALTTPQLDITAAAVQDIAVNQIAASVDNTISLTTDTINPTFTSSTLNEGTGVLTITFNETIDATPSTLVDLTKLFISNTGNTDEITLSGAVVTATDGTTITITLTESQRQQVIALTTPQLDITAGAVRDISANQIAESVDNAISRTNIVINDSSSNTITINSASILSQITYSDDISDPVLDYTGFSGTSITTGSNPITITANGIPTGTVTVIIPSETTISGEEFSRQIALPQQNVNECSSFNLSGNTMASCMSIGQVDVDLNITKPVSISFAGQALNFPYFIDTATIPITTQCTANTLSATTLQLITDNPGPDECFIISGANMIIWTDHFTAFGTALPSSGGGSSSESSPPSFTTSFDEGTETISLNGIGIAPEPFRTDYILDNPILAQTGQSIPISLTMYENLSWEHITHVELCLNKQVSNNRICDSDTKIIWDKNSDELEIIDPNGLIDSVIMDITKVDRNVATFDYMITFTNTMDTSALQIYSWDNKRNALTFTIENALTVIQGTTQSTLGNFINDSSNIIPENTASCVAGQLLLDNGVCMDPEPGTFTCSDDEVMNLDGTCSMIDITSTTHTNPSDTQSIDTIHNI